LHGRFGRLGLRGQWTIPGPNGQVWQPYVRANVWRDWSAEATTTFGIDPVPLLEQATRLEFAGGVTAKLSPTGASTPRAAISSPPASPTTPYAATPSWATSACGTIGRAVLGADALATSIPGHIAALLPVYYSGPPT
jgi:Autotransporter beta-domain